MKAKGLCDTFHFLIWESLIWSQTQSEMPKCCSFCLWKFVLAVTRRFSSGPTTSESFKRQPLPQKWIFIYFFKIALVKDVHTSSQWQSCGCSLQQFSWWLPLKALALESSAVIISNFWCSGVSQNITDMPRFKQPFSPHSCCNPFWEEARESCLAAHYVFKGRKVRGELLRRAGRGAEELPRGKSSRPASARPSFAGSGLKELSFGAPLEMPHGAEVNGTESNKGAQPWAKGAAWWDLLGGLNFSLLCDGEKGVLGFLWPGLSVCSGMGRQRMPLSHTDNTAGKNHLFYSVRPFQRLHSNPSHKLRGSNHLLLLQVCCSCLMSLSLIHPLHWG